MPPWNSASPTLSSLRVAEKVAMLDQVSGGRVRFGMGRGLSRREFAPFRDVEMDQSRERFDEASLMIVDALKTGFIEGDGPFYPQPRAEIRPRPSRPFDDRIYAVANSADSVEACARVGGRMIMFSEAHWDRRLPSIEKYRERYRHYHDQEPPPLMTADFTFCHEDADHAREVAEQCMATYLQSLLEHYELMGDHFKEIPGYQGYEKNAETLRAIGEAGFLKGFMRANAFGTPDEILTTLDKRRAVKDRIKRLVLLNSIAYPQKVPSFFKILRTPVLGHLGATAAPPELQTQTALMLAYYDDSIIRGQDVAAYSRPLYTPGGKHALVRTAQQIIPSNLPSIARRYNTIRKPVFIAVLCRRYGCVGQL